MKTIFFDVDTQLDFVFPAGALYVPGAENIVDNLGKLTRYAAAHSYQIISTADAHTEDDPEFKIWKPHCVAGTVGQHKIAATVSTGSQIIIEKQMLDCFTNPTLRPLLTSWRRSGMSFTVLCRNIASNAPPWACSKLAPASNWLPTPFKHSTPPPNAP